MDSPKDPEEPKSSIQEFVTNTTAALTKGTLKTEGSSQLSNDGKMVSSKEPLPATESLPTMGEKEIVEGSSQLSNDGKMVSSKESLPAAESLPTMGEKEIVEGSSQLSKDGKMVSSKESLPTAESMPTMGEKEIVEGSSQLSNDGKMVSSKESLPAAESMSTMGEKEIVCSVSSSLHGSQKPTVNKITSKGSLVQVQESSSSSSSSGLLSSASRVLSGILKSRWNLKTHPPTSCSSSTQSFKIVESKPKEFDGSASQQLTPSQPQSFAPKALAEHDQPDEPTKRTSFLDEIDDMSSGDQLC